MSTRPLVRLLRYADEVQAAAGPRRRVLAAVKELAAAGCRRVALYGAGKHTMRVLGTCDFPGVDLVAILDDDPAACGGKILGIPVHPRDDAASLNLDAVIVSSDYHEAALLEKIRLPPSPRHPRPRAVRR
ncbi:MAG: hypothetical protein M5R36_18370 [Deltaproteobacteria bacterium]|nr:hypothetical protein [Deltaproteobacteria bacterium]